VLEVCSRVFADTSLGVCGPLLLHFILFQCMHCMGADQSSMTPMLLPMLIQTRPPVINTGALHSLIVSTLLWAPGISV
jgi:hypothetical protein